MFLLLCALWLPGSAQAQAGAGFEPYQKSFARALEALGGGAAPSGPRWLQSPLHGTKEACTTCHLGVTDQRFLFARAPFRRHSGHYLEDHPARRFACTVCHAGFGAGLTFKDAGHAPPAGSARRESWKKFYDWSPPASGGMLPLADISGRCRACHAETAFLQGAEPYQDARELVAEKLCTKCHVFRDEPPSRTRRAVELAGIGSKLTRDWLKGYLPDPHAFRPTAAMPGASWKQGDLDALSAFLGNLLDPAIPWTGGDPSKDAAAVKRGLEIVQTRRCWTCHDVPGIDDEGFIKQLKIGPRLARVGGRTNPEWFRKWLADPHAVRPSTQMPRFRLARQEIEDITAFLCSLRSAGQGVPAPPSRAVDGSPQVGHAVRAHACTNCHTIPGLESGPAARGDLTNVAPVLFARAAAADAGLSRVEGPDGLFHTQDGSPRILGPGEDGKRLLTFLAGEVQLDLPVDLLRPAPARPREFVPGGPAGKLVERFRCLSCHTIRGTGGTIGPELTYAGSKLRKDWIVEFLQKPTLIRPMNRARMPILGISEKEARTLADWITSELKAPPADQVKPGLDLAFAFVGASKVKTPYGCITCHRIGEEGGQVGPELSHVARRLRTTWIYHWIENPQHWIRDVRMPRIKMSADDRGAITRFLSEQK